MTFEDKTKENNKDYLNKLSNPETFCFFSDIYVDLASLLRKKISGSNKAYFLNHTCQ